MRIDSPLGGEPCAARIPVKCEYESLDLLKLEYRGVKPPSSWRSAQVPQSDGCTAGSRGHFWAKPCGGSFSPLEQHAEWILTIVTD